MAFYGHITWKILARRQKDVILWLYYLENIGNDPATLGDDVVIHADIRYCNQEEHTVKARGSRQMCINPLTYGGGELIGVSFFLRPKPPTNGLFLP
jgi:hypothetical protein